MRAGRRSRGPIVPVRPRTCSGENPRFRRCTRTVRAEGTPAAVLDRLGGLDAFAELAGIAEIRDLERAYRDDDAG